MEMMNLILLVQENKTAVEGAEITVGITRTRVTRNTKSRQQA